MKLVRTLLLLPLQYSFVINSCYLPGTLHTISGSQRRLAEGQPTGQPNPSSIHLDSEELEEDPVNLSDLVFAPSMFKKYEKHWQDYLNFVLDFDHCFSEHTIVEYIRYIFYFGYTHTAISSRLSAISQGLQARHEVDWTKANIPQLLVRATKRLTKLSDHRRPFSEDMIKQLIRVLPRVFDHPFMVTLYSAISFLDILWMYAHFRVHQSCHSGPQSADT